MSDVLAGAAAGCAATVPMTLVMDRLHRRLPRRERYPLPPRQVALRVTREAGVRQRLDEPDRYRVTLLSHFGMGTAAGALYGALGRRLPLPTVLRGAAYGLGVWAVNYLGILPALGILRPATEHPPRRNGLMIAAHLVWGTATALLVEMGDAQER